MEQSTKKFLIYVCVGIVILIILRVLYTTIKDNNYNIENFIIDNNNAVDLLSTKIKSKAALLYSTEQTTNPEYKIHPWSNKIYNLENITQQQKPIALYKPNLSINNVQYCKLGDMISQDVNFDPPTVKEFTLLIKKIGSDIKPPTDYSLIVDSGNKYVNPSYYDYSGFISNVSSIYNISLSLSNCSTSLFQLNSVVQNNLTLLTNTLQTKVYKTASIYIYPNNYPISKCIESQIDISTNKTGAQIITKDTLIVFPAGITASISGKDIPSKNISIPESLNNMVDKDDILSNLPPIYKITKEEIHIVNDTMTSTFNIPIFTNIPIEEVIDYITILCLDIKNIYDTQSDELLTFLNLASSKQDVIKLLDNIYHIIDITQIDLNTFIAPYKNTTTLLGNILNLILTAKIQYNITYIWFLPKNIDTNFDENIDLKFQYTSSLTIPASGVDITSVSLSNFIPDYTTTLISTIINSNSMKNINTFNQFIINLKNQTIIDFPLQIYNPLPPDGYLSLGHIFCNIASDLVDIKAAQNVACVPKNCVKEIRDWISSDKIFEYNKDGKYWAIYFNPYTGTFISTNTPQLPTGKVSKVVACVAKCTAVDDLKKADECARKYYNINKKALSSTPVISSLVSDQEEEFYLSKIKVQSDSIAKLGQRAQQMQLNMDKASIVNREMNKNVLQDYVDTQKRNIAIIMQRLIDDRNKITTNVNMTTHVFNTILESPTIPPEQKKLLISKLNTDYTANLNEVLYSLPQYDLTGLVKKSLVSDVVYGCEPVN